MYICMYIVDRYEHEAYEIIYVQKNDKQHVYI